MESPADGPGGGLGMECEVSTLFGRGVQGGSARNHGSCNGEVIVLLMVLCLRTWDGLQEWNGLAKRVVLYESEQQTELKQLRSLHHLTWERRGREMAKRLLLYDIQGQSVQHSFRPQQHMPNMQSGAHPQTDVCVRQAARADHSDRPLGHAVPRAMFVIFEQQVIHHLRPAAASSIPIVCRQNALLLTES